MTLPPPDPAERLKPKDVEAKTMQGASLMVLRTLVLYPVGFVGEVVLARLLSPEDFGVYALASFVTVTLAAVLEGPEEPEHLPAQLIRPERCALTWLVDEDATANLDARER